MSKPYDLAIIGGGIALDAAGRGRSVHLGEAGELGSATSTASTKLVHGEITALGAAYLAGLDAGLVPEPEAFQQRWAPQASFHPAMPAAERGEPYAGWRNAVARAVYQP